eukprot:2683259-Rhodomonas_salina.6
MLLSGTDLRPALPSRNQTARNRKLSVRFCTPGFVSFFSGVGPGVDPPKQCSLCPMLHRRFDFCDTTCWPRVHQCSGPGLISRACGCRVREDGREREGGGERGGREDAARRGQVLCGPQGAPARGMRTRLLTVWDDGCSVLTCFDVLAACCSKMR